MNFDRILEELNAELERPRPQEVCVREDALAERARRMAAGGYVHGRESLAALEAYMRGYGLLLSGKVGTGKTMFFRLLKPTAVRVQQTGELPRIVIFSMVKTLGMTVDDLNGVLADHAYDELVLDDVGAEPVFNFYGGKMEILPYLLDRRMESPCRTHMTTNATHLELGRRYGARVMDRLIEMFARFEFKGPSRRTLKPNAAIRRAQVAAARNAPKGGAAGAGGLPQPDRNQKLGTQDAPRGNPQGENG